MFERNYEYFFFRHCLLSCRYVMFQKQYFEKTKMGAQAVVRGGTAPLVPPVATALAKGIMPRSNSTKRAKNSEISKILLCSVKTFLLALV